MSKFKTPLRYPGGKQRLSPFIVDILSENLIDGHYVEPYAGGAGVGIDLLLSKKIKHIHLNDTHLGIYAFWHSIINNNEKFCKEIYRTSITVDEWKKRKEIVKRLDTSNLFELGFSTFYLNRCNRSGILTAGLIGGYSQQGKYKMDARFNRIDLIRRIETIGLFANQISISKLDAEYYIKNYISNLPNNTLIYLDPPYYKKASDLYVNSYKNSDHLKLSKVIQNEIKHKWILSYDGVEEILNLYTKRRHFLYDLQYSADKVYKGKEVFVFSDNIKLPESCSLDHVNSGLENLVIGQNE